MALRRKEFVIKKSGFRNNKESEKEILFFKFKIEAKCVWVFFG